MPTTNKDGWRLRDFRLACYNAEKKSWQKFYLPFSVKGKTVLDVGAGEGESAKFFLEQGAAKVLCVECGSLALGNLRYNAQRHSELTVIGEPFNSKHLDLECDLVKIDIEGYEEQLLELTPSCPIVVEIHGLQLRDRFAAAGWRVVNPRSSAERLVGCTTYGYWRC